MCTADFHEKALQNLIHCKHYMFSINKAIANLWILCKNLFIVIIICSPIVSSLCELVRVDWKFSKSFYIKLNTDLADLNISSWKVQTSSKFVKIHERYMKYTSELCALTMGQLITNSTSPVQAWWIRTALEWGGEKRKKLSLVISPSVMVSHILFVSILFLYSILTFFPQFPA